MPMNPTEMILFDYGLTVSYVNGKGLDKNLWEEKLTDEKNFRRGVSNPKDIYSVVGLELKFHMKWTR